MCPELSDYTDKDPNAAEHLTHREQIPLPLSGIGSTDSPGPTGEPSPSELGVPKLAMEPTADVAEEVGVRLVRHHKGLSNILVGFLSLNEDSQGTFSALKRGEVGVYTVTLSCDLTSSQYANLVRTLETSPSVDGATVSVDLKFEPTTPNLVPPSTAPSI